MNTQNVTVDADMRRHVVNRAIASLEAHYIDQNVARAVAEELPQRVAVGGYCDLIGPDEFAARLTAELQSITQDKHIRVRHNPIAASEPSRNVPSEDEQQEYVDRGRACNFGMERVERLPHNIGYIDIRGFMQASVAGEAVAAAMTLVAHTDALVFDLRRNRGGDPATVALLSSYLFDKRTHLNSIYFREGERTEQFWSHDWVPGTRYGQNKPVFVLVSQLTFSAAEEFAYNLKSLRRGIVVGESTGGGAHPGGYRWLSDHFSVFVPFGRPVNPVSQSNWEGVGVEPDVRTPAADALRVAQLLALRELAKKSSDPARSRLMHERIEELEADPPEALDP